MKRLVVMTALAACSIEDAPDEGVVESTLTETQGSEYQGSEYQGSEYQGSEYQGSEYQGSEYQGSEYDGTAFDMAFVTGTALMTWQQLPNQDWEQRKPNELCVWDPTLTYLRQPCTVYNLATQASPLAGTTWPAKFTKVVNGIPTTVTGTIRIGSHEQDVGAVLNDTSTAMHPLQGTPAQTCQPSTAPCSNPNGCRNNCDLFTYEVWLITAAGDELSFCPGGGRAYALSGTWSKNGTRTGSASQFTLACPTGTIAKCTRWGYRPFSTAIKSDGTTASMSDYHQACVRAATADYCANGHSFTKNGTLVDIYDYGNYFGHQGPSAGFVPRAPANTVFAWESEFDKYGAVWLDHMRYEELAGTTGYGSIDDASTGGCPTRWWTNGSDDVGANYNRQSDCGGTTPCGPVGNARVMVSASTSCAHSEQTVGDWLHPYCNFNCTFEVGEALPHCTDPSSSKGWDQECVTKAASICKNAAGRPPMAAHSECTTGGSLNKWDSACTFAVCSQNPACCGGYAGWNQSCVDLANSKCKGGKETLMWSGGFCTGPIINPTPWPGTGTSTNG